jgi:hypothetical protein
MNCADRHKLPLRIDVACLPFRTSFPQASKFSLYCSQVPSSVRRVGSQITSPDSSDVPPWLLLKDPLSCCSRS